MKACYQIVERRIFMQTSAEPNLFELCRVQPKSLVGKMYEIVNKQVKFLTSQYVGTCKSAYIKGYVLN
jgi:hypothetical protein